MGIFGRKGFDPKADKAKRKEIKSIQSEIDDIQKRLELESTRYRLELEQIFRDGSSVNEALLATFKNSVNRVERNDDARVVKTAEHMLSLADFDSKVASNTSDSLIRLSDARNRHLEMETQLIERRTACFMRWRELISHE